MGFLLLAYNYLLFHNFFAFPENYWIGYDGQSVKYIEPILHTITHGAVWTSVLVVPRPGFLLADFGIIHTRFLPSG